MLEITLWRGGKKAVWKRQVIKPRQWGSQAQDVFRRHRKADIFDRVKAGRTGLKWQRWKRVLRWVPVLWVFIIKGRKVSGVNSRSGCWKGVSPKGCGGDCSMPLSQHRAFAGNLCHSILGCVDAASQSLPSFSRGTLPVCLSVSKFHLFYKDDIILV